MDRLLRTEETDIEQLKTLIPKLLIGCKQYLHTNYDFGDELIYKDIVQIFRTEYQGNLDECGTHYQLDTRTNDEVLPIGRINFNYNSRFDSTLDIHVTDQGSGHQDARYKDKVDEIVDHIKGLLDEEDMSYEDILMEENQKFTPKSHN